MYCPIVPSGLRTPCPRSRDVLLPIVSFEPPARDCLDSLQFWAICGRISSHQILPENQHTLVVLSELHYDPTPHSLHVSTLVLCLGFYVLISSTSASLSFCHHWFHPLLFYLMRYNASLFLFMQCSNCSRFDWWEHLWTGSGGFFTQPHHIFKHTTCSRLILQPSFPFFLRITHFSKKLLLPF